MKKNAKKGITEAILRDAMLGTGPLFLLLHLIRMEERGEVEEGAVLLAVAGALLMGMILALIAMIVF